MSDLTCMVLPLYSLCAVDACRCSIPFLPRWGVPCFRHVERVSEATRAFETNRKPRMCGICIRYLSEKGIAESVYSMRRFADFRKGSGECE